MPPIRRFDSDTTHVSDSEPERETAREAARLVRAHKTRTSRTCTSSARRRSSTPFSDSSNTQQIPEPAAIEPYFGLEARLSNLESEVAQLRVPLKAPTPQRPEHGRSLADKCVGNDFPIDTPENPPLAAPNSFHDAVQEEVRVQLGVLHQALDEFEQLVESSESRKCLLESSREL
ncbi:hypothetical protein DFH08DRAFT_875101 [Mycena albidolilacea]|uniref:Uncharacterized protein n=1 Tax=Mycena albidolilacea TaxID=1033008 RepID=A0AAD7EMQ7_9AGAR|nr:hypothetical protein DFH08DRAFT_875101 [Mycena albidolilacea]